MDDKEFAFEQHHKKTGRVKEARCSPKEEADAKAHEMMKDRFNYINFILSIS